MNKYKKKYSKKNILKNAMIKKNCINYIFKNQIYKKKYLNYKIYETAIIPFNHGIFIIWFQVLENIE